MVAGVLFHADTSVLLADILAKGFVLLLLTWAAAILLRRACAATRELIWRAGALGALALAALALWPPVHPLALLPRPREERGAAANTPPVEPRGAMGVAHSGENRGPFAAPQPAPPRPLADGVRAEGGALSWITLAGALQGLWALGVVAALAPLLRALAATVHLLRSEAPAPREWYTALDAARRHLGLRRSIRVMGTEAVAVPLVWDLLPWRPAVLVVPARGSRWSAESRRAALLHELAHLRRRDCPAQLLARLGAALFWPNPLAWRALREMRRTAEQACDDLALAAGERPSAYAGHLLAIAAAGAPPLRLATASWSSPGGGDLQVRIRAILDDRRRRPAGPARIVVPWLASLATLAPLSLAAAHAAPPSSSGVDRSAQDRVLERGLSWLAQAQDTASGGWLAGIGYKLNTGFVTIAEGTPHAGVSALALMAFLESGARPGKGPRGELMRRGTDYLLGCLRKDGSIQSHGTRMKSHAYALLYLARLAGSSRDEALRARLQRAVDFTCLSQGPRGGWRYQPYARDSDILVSAAMLGALRAARDGGLRVSARSLERAEKHIREHLLRRGPRVLFSYQVRPAVAKVPTRSRTTLCTTAAGLAVLLPGRGAERELLAGGLDALPAELRGLKTEGEGHYILWYARYLVAAALRAGALDEAGVERWKGFHRALRAELIREQRPDGSWVNQVGPGPAFATAMACLLLQAGA